MEECKLAAFESSPERGDQFVHAIDPLSPGAQRLGEKREVDSA